MTKAELQKVINFLESARQHGTVDGTLDKDAFDSGYKLAMMVLKLYPIDEKDDTVQVVRCKDCCHYDEVKDITGDYCGYCHFGFDDTSCIPVGRNGYCSSGKRREDE